MSAKHREIRGFDAVRAAARDYETYSSDLLGDRDVRTYRQLPLEADPPRHTQFRDAIQPLFSNVVMKSKAPQFEALAKRLIDDISAKGQGEITRDLALPYVIGCLTIIYNRPQDFDEWLSWGPDVWTAEAYAKGEVSAESQRAHRERDFTRPSQRSGKVMNDYLKRVFDAAEARVNTDPETKDVWDDISQLQIDGQPISRDEMLGIANVMLAGGRDTVIKLITGLTWHLLVNEADREFLRTNTDAFSKTIAEMVRYLSPLPKMERVLAEDRTARDEERDTSRYVLLSFVSANFDRSIWPDADVIDIHRDRKPNLAFGFGRHTCMGMYMTETEAQAFLSVIVNNWPEWQLAEEPEIEWIIDGEGAEAVHVIDKFDSLKVKR
jgi:cytochrome P450